MSGYQTLKGSIPSCFSLITELAFLMANEIMVWKIGERKSFVPLQRHQDKVKVFQCIRLSIAEAFTKLYGGGPL